jgi:hypothetical protein
VTKRRPGKTSWSPMPSKVKLGNRVVRHIFYSMVVCIILILLNLWSSSTYETQGSRTFRPVTFRPATFRPVAWKSPPLAWKSKSFQASGASKPVSGVYYQRLGKLA